MRHQSRIRRRRQTPGVRHGGAGGRAACAGRRAMNAMNEQEADSTVRGERDGTTLRQPPSVQSRVSNVLAISLMSVLGLGMLTWYYANAMTRQSHARQSAQASSAKRAQGDMPLPSLGRIDPPAAAAERPPAPQDQPAQSMPLSVTTLREIPL